MEGVHYIIWIHTNELAIDNNYICVNDIYFNLHPSTKILIRQSVEIIMEI